MRVVSIKSPPAAIDGVTRDSFRVGKVYEVSPNLAILLIAAGWMRGDTRARSRRTLTNRTPDRDRRQLPDRRLIAHASS